MPTAQPKTGSARILGVSKPGGGGGKSRSPKCPEADAVRPSECSEAHTIVTSSGPLLEVKYVPQGARGSFPPKARIVFDNPSQP